MASRLTDAEIVVLYKHVGRRLVSMNDELPKDASDDVKYLANSMLTTAAENDARYIKRCNTNFKNRTVLLKRFTAWIPRLLSTATMWRLT